MEGNLYHASSNTNYEKLILFNNTTKNLDNPNCFSIAKSNKNNKYIFDSNSSKNTKKIYYTGVASTKSKYQNNKKNKNYLEEIKRRIFEEQNKYKKNNTQKFNQNTHIHHNKTSLGFNDNFLGYSANNNSGNNEPKNIFKSKTKANFLRTENCGKSLVHNSSNLVLRTSSNYSNISFNNIFKQNLINKYKKNVSLNDLIISQDNDNNNNKFLITEYSHKKDNDLFRTNEEIINEISLKELSISNHFNSSFLFEDFISLKKDFELFYTKKFIDGINNDLIDLEYNLALYKIFGLVMSYNYHIEKVFNENNSLKITIKSLYSKIKEMNKKYSKLKNKRECFIRKLEYRNLIKENDLNFNVDIKSNKIHQIQLLNNMLKNRIDKKQRFQSILKVIYNKKPQLFDNKINKIYVNEKMDKKSDINKGGNLKLGNSNVALNNMKLQNNNIKNKIYNKSFFNKSSNNKPTMTSSKSEYYSVIIKNNNKYNKNEIGKYAFKNKFKIK